MKPFIKKITELKAQDKAIIYVSSDNDRNLYITIAYDNNIFEFRYSTKNPHAQTNLEVFLLEDNKMQWKNKYEKIKILKKDAETCSPKEIIEKIAVQVNIHKKYTQIDNASLVEIYKKICFVTESFCKNNQLDINVSMDLNRQNHWLD